MRERKGEWGREKEREGRGGRTSSFPKVFQLSTLDASRHRGCCGSPEDSEIYVVVTALFLRVVKSKIQAVSAVPRTNVVYVIYA